MRAIDPAHFPNVVASLREAGLDPARELIPVAPAAHYMMGGIVTDLQARSTVPGLYAVGESSCTGLHGANRLASNSLSECFVFARRAIAGALSEPAPPSSAAAGRARARGARARSRRPSAPRPPRARRCGATPASCAPARGSSGCSSDPHPLARLIARCALAAHREPRGAPALGPPRARSGARPPPRRRLRRDAVAWQTWA